MRWHEQIVAAVGAIDAVVGPRGQWPGWVVVQNSSAASARDVSAPLTALGMLCLRGVPGAEVVLERSRQHLALTVQPGGVWRYYANIPWDIDDTCMCALALGLDDPLLSETATSLVGAVRADGLFATWPTWPHAQQGLDAVANAHLVAVLGDVPVTARAIAWLNEVVRAEVEVDSCSYYPDPLDLHMAISRAVVAGVQALQPALELAAPRAMARLEADAPAHRMAQAICIALAGGVAPADLVGAAARLADKQGADGFWPVEVLFTAVNTEDYGGLNLYTSQAVSTALCAQALSKVVVP